MDELFDRHAGADDKIHDAVGAPKGSIKSKGLDSKDVVACRQRVAEALEANLNDNPGLTELVTPLFEAWGSKARDVDKPLIAWLRGGTPAGITREVETANIFPECTEAPHMDLS